MKNTTLRFTILLLLFLPCTLKAQWNMVRFDNYNFFNKAFTASANSVIITGFDPMGNSFILRSNSGGSTWDSISLNTFSGYYHLGELFFTDVNNGFAGGLQNSNQTLLKTLDNGSNWVDVTPDLLSIEAISSISFITPQQGFAATETYIYKTTDGGATWTTLTPGFYIRDISFQDNNNGYACGNLGTNAVIMKTNDGGQTWTNAFTLVSTGASMAKLDVVNSNVCFSSMMYTNTIYSTVDGGINWNTITMPPIFDVQDYDFTSATEGHILSTMGEIFGTSDGGITWTLEYAVAGGFYGPSIYLYSLSFVDQTGYVCGSDGLIKKYTVAPTSVAENNNDAISLFPNPVASGGTLSIAGLSDIQTIEIYNNVGQLMLKQNINTADIFNAAFNNLDLAAGLYTISFKTTHELIKKKFIVAD